MNAAGLRIAESLVPPSLWKLLRSRFGNRFEGDYATWSEAKSACGGYDDTSIVERVTVAAREVAAGRAVFERDGVLLDRVDYSWPVIACLLLIACERGGALSVVDFGGSLGTSYRQAKTFLDRLNRVSWAVVEQAAFVSAGKREFQDERLHFFDNLDEALREQKPDVVLLSGVIQYLPDPVGFLEQLVEKPVDFLLFDRTPLIAGARARLTIQRVPRHIYPASYPAWFLSRAGFFSTLEKRFTLIETFAAADRANIAAEYVGSLWQRRE
jgi:putative methyltransferase (TIGR04325 family)